MPDIILKKGAIGFIRTLLKPINPGIPQGLSSDQLFRLRVAALQNGTRPTKRTYALANKMAVISSGQSGGVCFLGFIFSFFWLSFGFMTPRVIILASVAVAIKIIYLLAFDRNFSTLLCLFAIMTYVGFYGYVCLWHKTGKRINDAWSKSNSNIERAISFLIDERRQKRRNLIACLEILACLESLYIFFSVLYLYFHDDTLYYFL
jgi:hypothetical protein